MPNAPLLPPDEMSKATGTAGLSPENFLMAAADLHQQGNLSSPVPQGIPLQTGKTSSRHKRIRVVK